MGGSNINSGTYIKYFYKVYNSTWEGRAIEEPTRARARSISI